MWMMILLNEKWYGREYDGEGHLREDMDNLFAYVNNGEVISIFDDLDTWCDEMDVDREDIIIVEVE